MRRLLAGILIACASVASAVAQVSVGVSIGMHLPVYPQLVAVPGYPVYYAPALNANFFFYDGMYWVYQGDHWYMSAWYNGPWTLVSPLYVPPYVLLVPVRYYRLPPPYFRPWRADAPPRWGEHWGDDWQRHRKGWDQWNRAAVPPPAPLPVYQCSIRETAIRSRWSASKRFAASTTATSRASPSCVGNTGHRPRRFRCGRNRRARRRIGARSRRTRGARQLHRVRQGCRRARAHLRPRKARVRDRARAATRVRSAGKAAASRNSPSARSPHQPDAAT